MNYYIVDAFTDEIFRGNPAGVCLLDGPLDEALMQKIAFENNLPETAFVLKTHDGYHLRWFTPKAEIGLCGHATLASAYIIFRFLEPQSRLLSFTSQGGALSVRRAGERYELDFPAKAPEPIPVDGLITEAVGFQPLEAHSQHNLYLVVEDEARVRSFVPNYERLSKLSQWHAVVLTARGERQDFVSRFFCPELPAEDPVTGSSHCSLIPLWAEKLGKTTMEAAQLSQRGGLLHCELAGERVKISGGAVLYLEGKLLV